MALILCPKCEAQVSDQAPTCPACKASLKSRPKALASGLVECPKCGAEVSSLASACPACKTSLASVAPPPLPPMPSFFPTVLQVLVAPAETFTNLMRYPYGSATWPMLLMVAALNCVEDLLKGEGLLRSLITLVILPPVGWLGLCFIAWLYQTIGAWFGGRGSFDDLFESVVWGMSSSFMNSALGILQALSGGVGGKILWGALGIVVAIWSFIVGLFLLATAHRYSAGSAFATIITLIVLVASPFLAILLVLKLVG